MKKIIYHLPFIVLLCCSLGSIDAYAAKTQAKKFTKRYHNEKLIVVLNDFCKNSGYTLNIVDEIDHEKRITEDFKNAGTSSVMRKVLDKDYQYKVKKGVLTITRKPAPPVTYSVQATEPSEVADNDSITRKIYIDTTFTVTCSVKTIEEKIAPKAAAPEPQKQKEDTTGVKRLEHNLQILIGGGYGSLGYSLGADGQTAGQFAGNAQLRYLYYFSPNWGIGLGAGFAYYGSSGTLNTTTVFTPEVHDSDGSAGESYEHRVKSHDWQETQRAYMLDIPVLIQCTYPIREAAMENGPLKLYADLGADLGLTLAASRMLKSGSIDHTGWYSPWKLEMEHIDGHDFFTEQASDFETSPQSFSLRMPAIGLTADFGIALPMTANLDLLIGLYGTYTVNDVCASRQDIGWKQTNATGYKAHDFMNPYSGLIGTQYASAVHPWQTGLRIGINFNARTQKKEKEPEPEIIYHRVNVCDTTFTLAERVETTVKPVAVQKIKRVLAKSVIWFDLNSAVPKLEPADILIQVAEILKENPEQKILVTGHASRDGDQKRNRRLSEERAEAVVEMLKELGVRADQMESRGEGVERDYIQGTHDISLDRRVEITPVE